MNKEEAISLWESLSEHLTTADRLMTRIIDERAWVPLNKSLKTCLKEYVGQNSLSLLSRQTLINVILSLGEENNFNVQDTAKTLSGLVYENQVASIFEQFEHGVPENFIVLHNKAQVTVSDHSRSLPRTPSVLKVSGFTQEELQKFSEIASACGRNRETIAASAIRKAFLELSERNDRAGRR